MPTIGGKSFRDRSTGGTPILQRSDTGSVNWESDWVQVPALDSGSNYSTLPITHNLGTETPIVQVYVKHLTTGKIQNIGQQLDEETGAITDTGASYQPTDGNSGIIRFYENVFGEHPTDTGEIGFLVVANSSEYRVKVVATAGAGAGGGAGGGEIPRTQWPVRAVDGLNSPNMLGNLTGTEFLWKYSPQTRCNLGEANSWVFSCVRGLNGSSPHNVVFTRDKDLVKAYHGDSNSGHGCSVTTVSNAGSYNRGGYVICQTGEDGWHQVSTSANPGDGYGVDANIMAYVNPTAVSNVIHNGSTSNTWTNMSTGYSNSLVMLLVEPLDGAAVANTWFKRGSDNNIYKTSTSSWTGHGCAAGIISGLSDAGGTPYHRGHYAFCMTDSSGNLSVASSVSSSAKVTLTGYVQSATTSDSTLLTNSLVADAPEAVKGTGSGEDGTYGTNISTGLTGHNLVLLKTIGTSGTGNNIYFRTPGDSVTMYRSSTWMGQGCAAGYMHTTGATYQVAMTDSSGNLKAFSSNQSNCTITMIGSTSVRLS